MPLETFKHKTSKNLWIKGWVEFEGARIAGPYRCSSGSPTKAGAENWIAAETDFQRRKHMVGEEAAQTFSDAVLIYNANAKTAKQLLPIDREIGDTPLNKITGKLLKSLDVFAIYPLGCFQPMRQDCAAVAHPHRPGSQP